MKTRKFVITVPDMKGFNEADWKEYLKDAIGGWKGGFGGDHPLFDMERDGIEVKRFRSAEKAPKPEFQDTDTMYADDMVAYQCRIIRKHDSLGYVMEYRHRVPNSAGVRVSIRRGKGHIWWAEWISGKKQFGRRIFPELSKRQFSTSLSAAEWVWNHPGIFIEDAKKYTN